MMNNMREQIDYGANIGAGGGSGDKAHITCVDLGKGYFVLSQVDSNGAVLLGRDKKYQRLTVLDLEQKGVVLDLDNCEKGKRVIKPKGEAIVLVGTGETIIKGTDTSGVLFNGENPVPATPELRDQMYPKYGIDKKRRDFLMIKDLPIRF